MVEFTFTEVVNDYYILSLQEDYNVHYLYACNLGNYTGSVCSITLSCSYVVHVSFLCYFCRKERNILLCPVNKTQLLQIHTGKPVLIPNQNKLDRICLIQYLY